MPEGPSILILKEETENFQGKKVLEISGSTTVDVSRAVHKKVLEFRTWGKHFLICFDDFTIRIHLMLFGSYKINEGNNRVPKLSLVFSNGEINFYACAIKILDGDINTHYDWSEDIMSDEWDSRKAKAKLKEFTDSLICDVLLEQEIFSGVGNIIKNEALYRVRLHPESVIKNIPDTKLRELIKETRNYSFDFLKWKKKNELKKNWLAYTKKKCLRCDLPILKNNKGTKKRRNFYCDNCQIRYS